MSGRIVVQPLDIMAAPWSFRENAPTWAHGRYGSRSTYDPFPAYAHDDALAAEMAEHVTASWPPAWDVDLMVANREEVGRSNGFSSVSQAGRHVGDEYVKDPPRGLIVLAGKRIPPHPAMTRYLVAHEYGHNVEYMLNDARGHALQSDELIREYAKVRGLDDDAVHHAAGGSWHDSAAEIFACDFRILITHTELEFWPHPGIPRPEDVPAIWRWWSDALDAVRQSTQPSTEE